MVGSPLPSWAGLAARAAAELGFTAYTSSLLYSRYQNHETIRRLGEEYAVRYRAFRTLIKILDPSAQIAAAGIADADGLFVADFDLLSRVPALERKRIGLVASGGSGATAVFGSLMWTAAVLETAGGLLLVLGLFTRPVAFLLCGEMAVAYFRQHSPRGFWPILNGGELAVLYCFIFLYLAIAGAGPVSLDRLIREKS